jgi:hypothetical protein
MIGEANASESHEYFIVLLANTVVEPFAMMIESVCASVALATVFRFLIEDMRLTNVTVIVSILLNYLWVSLLSLDNRICRV